jgi:hypothetical protein
VEPKTFTVTAADGGRGRLFIPVPLDLGAAWGPRTRHPVGGTVNGRRVRAVVEETLAGYGFLIGAAWIRDNPITVGDEVAVTIAPEGPQRIDLAEDVAGALAASPAAAAFFDTLAQFYRKGYLRWVDATKQRPAVRAARIAEMVALLEAGVKQRP